jgi:hypothetical protein
MNFDAGVALAIVTALLSFAGSWGGASARLKLAEREAQRAHERIDHHLNQHIEGNL